MVILRDNQVIHLHRRYWWAPVVLLVLAIGSIYYVDRSSKREIADQKAEFFSIIQSIVSKEPTLITDPNGNTVAYNPALAKFLKLDNEHIMQMNVASLIQAEKDSIQIAGALRQSVLSLPNGTELPVIVKYRSYPSDSPQIFDVKLQRKPAEQPP